MLKRNILTEKKVNSKISKETLQWKKNIVDLSHGICFSLTNTIDHMKREWLNYPLKHNDGIIHKGNSKQSSLITNNNQQEKQSEDEICIRNRNSLMQEVRNHIVRINKPA